MFSRRIVIICTALAFAVGLVVYRYLASPGQPQRHADAALLRGQYRQAEELANQILAQDPQSASALLIAAKASALEGRYREAIDYYGRAEAAGAGLSAEALFDVGDGLNPATDVEEIRIDWPAGTTQAFHGFPSNTELMFIEGRSSPIVISAGR